MIIHPIKLCVIYSSPVMRQYSRTVAANGTLMGVPGSVTGGNLNSANWDRLSNAISTQPVWLMHIHEMWPCCCVFMACGLCRVLTLLIQVSFSRAKHFTLWSLNATTIQDCGRLNSYRLSLGVARAATGAEWGLTAWRRQLTLILFSHLPTRGWRPTVSSVNSHNSMMLCWPFVTETTTASDASLRTQRRWVTRR